MTFPNTPAPSTPIAPIFWAVAAAIVIAGFGLRLQGAMGELWFDEIWSLNTAFKLDAWHEAFWKAPKDNNHPLNTWWIFVVGQGQDPWLYRLLSIVTGTLSIMVAGWLSSRTAQPLRSLRLIAVMAVVAFGYPFVNFGSEARGYAPMMLWALLAYGSLERPDTTARQARWGYGLAGILGVLSHFSILPILLALSMSFAIRQWLNGQTIAEAVQATVRLNGPLLGGLLVFVLSIGYGIVAHGTLLEFGGSTLTCGDHNCFVTALDEMTQFTLGGFSSLETGVYTSLYVTFVIIGAGFLFKVGNPRAVPLGLVLIGVPVVFVILGQPAIPHGRYFFATFIFLPLLMVEILAEAFQRNPTGRILASVGLVAFVAANIGAMKPFLTTGRGTAQQALAYVLEHSKPGPIFIGTDVIFQLKTVLDYHHLQQSPERPITIVKYKSRPTHNPQWLISVTIHTQYLPQTACRGEYLYTLVNGYGHWGMAGSTWGLYQLRSTPTSTPTSKPTPEDCS